MNNNLTNELIKSCVIEARIHKGEMTEPENLSPRELEVLQMLTSGMKYKDIATTLEVYVGTIKTHMSRVREKLGALNNEQAVLLAVRRGLIE